MSPQVFLLGFGLFFATLFLHILIWRFRRPRRDAPAILFLFLFAVPAVFLLISRFAGCPCAIKSAALILHLALSCAYIQIYPASQADSPSLRVLILVDRAPNGLTEKEIRSSFKEESLLEDRLEDLTVTGLVTRSGNSLSLTSKGRALITPFIWIRNIMGLKQGEG